VEEVELPRNTTTKPRIASAIPPNKPLLSNSSLRRTSIATSTPSVHEHHSHTSGTRSYERRRAHQPSRTYQYDHEDTQHYSDEDEDVDLLFQGVSKSETDVGSLWDELEGRHERMMYDIRMLEEKLELVSRAVGGGSGRIRR
jgi:hypothetical protein